MRIEKRGLRNFRQRSEYQEKLKRDLAIFDVLSERSAGGETPPLRN